MSVAHVWVGTSGWTYASWRGAFYPENLKSRHYLEYYARAFPTTEVNYSFYHLPRPQTYTNWANQVPENFLFSVKASRLITHNKRLVDVEEAWEIFTDNASTLGAQLGPILLQFPPSFKADKKRLEDFFKLTKRVLRRSPRLACEFRHESWFTKEIYRMLEKYGAALCIADSPKYPRKEMLTTDFTYIRFHGRSELFASRYSEEELSAEVKKIARYLKKGIEVFVYFNNDARGYAVENARMLRSLLKA